MGRPSGPPVARPLIPDKDFLSKKAPPNYRAGIGRGAVGFTTRADLPLASHISNKVNAEQLSEPEIESDAEPNEVGLLSSSLSRNDQEAERVWAEVDAKRSKKRVLPTIENSSTQQEPLEKPKVEDYLWENLPAALDLTKRNKRLRTLEQQSKRSYVLPDSVLVSQLNRSTQNLSAVDESIEPEVEVLEKEAQSSANTEEPISHAIQWRVDREITSGAERARVLQLRLDVASKDVISQPEVQPETNVALTMDLYKLRSTLHAHTLMQPNDPQGWIKLAQTEEKLQNYRAARHAISVGTRRCPWSEPIWVEGLRLFSYKTSELQDMAVKAVTALPHSVKLWELRINSQQEQRAKLSIVHKALEANTEEAKLWKIAADLENDSCQKKEVLESAVEFCPQSTELWVDLCKTTLRAGKPITDILTRMRKQISDSWVTILSLINSELHEEFDDTILTTNEDLTAGVDFCIELKAIKTLRVLLKDKSTPEAIYSASRQLGISQCFEVFLPDEKVCIEWLQKDKENFESISKLSLEAFPRSRDIWKLVLSQIPQTLDEYLAKKPDDLFLYETGFDILRATDQGKYGYRLIEQALKHCVNIPSVLKCQFAMHFSDLGPDEVPDLAEKVHSLATDVHNFEAQYAITRLKLSDSDEVLMKALGEAVRQCPQSPCLWRYLASVSMRTKHNVRTNYIFTRALAILEIPKRGLVWADRLWYELNEGLEINYSLAAALRDCPTCGELLALQLLQLPRVYRKNEIDNVLKRLSTDDVPAVFLTAVGLEAWASGTGNAELWLRRAVEKDPRNGDCWMWLWRYVSERLGDIDANAILTKFLQTDSRGGRHWSRAIYFTQNYFKSRESTFLNCASTLKNVFACTNGYQKPDDTTLYAHPDQL